MFDGKVLTSCTRFDRRNNICPVERELKKVNSTS